ncbi:hypothetical protein MBLNU13_g04408t2 [Cladosporium sp. NU13]
MEPASAIGVASAAITFLDFSIDVCKMFSQIIKSDEGITKHNADVAATVKRYEEMAEALKTKGASSNSLQLGSEISSALEESIAVYTELLALVERLRQAKDVPVIGSLKAVYRSMRSREHVERLQRKAKTSRSAIAQGLLQATWETSTLNHESSAKAFRHLDKQDIEILAAIRARNSDLLRHLVESRRHFDATVSNLQISIQTGHDDITHKVDNLTQRLLELAKPGLREAFVDSLFFPDFQRRERDLSGPMPKTFEWIFNRNGRSNPALSRHKRWPSFPQWLEDPDSSQVYWLSGRAGSGKSTLMAYVIREDMALNRTEGHLKKWHGAKPLHVLRFFLFRPGHERQAGLEYLLRSLLYQLVISVPLMQDILMAKFLHPGCSARIATWPVETLKGMLVSALDAADDCCFFILIDGVDEFEAFQHLRGRCVDATDLVAFLFDLQEPKHVKLCISSRPELLTTRLRSGFMEAKLAELNRDDIRRFVDERIDAMNAIPEPGDRYRLSEEIIDRADGIFLWAAFAVAQMSKACHEGYGEDFSELWERLGCMGNDLNDAIAQMLRRINKAHRPSLGFCLQALRSWKDSGMRRPMPLASITASRSGEGIQTRPNFLAACRKEERDIEIFSQGIIEVKNSRFTVPEGDFALVRSHSKHCDESDLEHEVLDFELGEGAWVNVAHAGHYSEITGFCDAEVSLIHRSAYDFLFDPDGWNKEHLELCRSLLDQGEESEISVKVQAGLMKLLWIRPWPTGPISDGNKARSLPWRFAECANDLIEYKIGTAKHPLTQSDITSYVDDLLSSMRLELLVAIVEPPLIESRLHIPGDIYSHQMQNGCLQTLDEDRLLIFESTGLPQDLKIMANFESIFLFEIDRWDTSHNYAQKRLSDLDLRPITPLVQAQLLDMIAYDGYEVHTWWLDKAEVLLLNCIQRWVHALVRCHQSLDDSSLWTALGSDKFTVWRETAALEALVKNFMCPDRISNPNFSSLLDQAARIIEPWNPTKDDSGVQILRIAAEDTYKLRHEVLWPNASLQEVQLAVDPVCIHLGAFAHQQEDSTKARTPIGVITIHVSKPKDESTSAEPSSGTLEAQFRKLAVAPEWQGRGIGSKLVEQAGVVAIGAGAHSLWCDARTSALAFYERLGMQTEGSSFMRKGVELHSMMKLSLAYATIVSVATIAAATSCTSSNALPWPYTPDGDDGSTCNGNIGCEAIVAEGQCNALSLIDDTDTTCVQKLKMLKRAVNLDCTSSEGCFTFLDNSLLCLNQATGDYHDDVGGSGNAITGVYTGPDGKVQTVTGVTAEPTTTATTGSDSESSTASREQFKCFIAKLVRVSERSCGAKLECFAECFCGGTDRRCGTSG